VLQIHSAVLSVAVSRTKLPSDGAPFLPARGARRSSISQVKGAVSWSRSSLLGAQSHRAHRCSPIRRRSKARLRRSRAYRARSPRRRSSLPRRHRQRWRSISLIMAPACTTSSRFSSPPDSLPCRRSERILTLASERSCSGAAVLLGILQTPHHFRSKHHVRLLSPEPVDVAENTG
jgi:hypothetical protein